MFFEQLINGITLGSIYAIVALGYTLVFGVLDIINMAHGEIFMFGAFIGMLLITRFQAPIVVAFLGAILVTAAMGYLLERLALRPIRGRKGASHLASLISTIGISIFLENLAHHFFGAGNNPFPDLLCRHQIRDRFDHHLSGPDYHPGHIPVVDGRPFHLA